MRVMDSKRGVRCPCGKAVRLWYRAVKNAMVCAKCYFWAECWIDACLSDVNQEGSEL